MDLLLTPEAGLTGLFLASFLAATLLPGGSEALFLALVLAHPEEGAAALALATLGNTLGGMTTYGLGRLIPAQVSAGGTARFTVRHTVTLDRWGPAALLLAWAPLIGDALCAAAGWLRLAWLPCLLWMAVGKGARYGVLLLVAQPLLG